MEDEVCDEPGLVLVGNSFVKHQSVEFCRKDLKRKNVCYLERRIENITEKIDELVANSSEETVCLPSRYKECCQGQVRGGLR